MSNLIGEKIRRVAIFGGVYNNYLSLEATLSHATRLGADTFYCLGDLGGFGPYPDRVFPYLREDVRVHVMQGNYDHSVGHELPDCGCGYTDPSDNYFAQISYDYTLKNTSEYNREWLRGLPDRFRCQWAGKNIYLAHGSPRRVNEFLWASTSSDAFLEYLLQSYAADVLFVTHTGIPWIRHLSSGKSVVNVGAIGRPANHGKTSVDYVLVEIAGNTAIEMSLQSVAYDHERLAAEMRLEGLPDEFAQTILSGYWTTCLEVLPAKERALGLF